MYAIRNKRTNEIMEHADTLEIANAICEQYNEMGKEESTSGEYSGTYEVIEH